MMTVCCRLITFALINATAASGSVQKIAPDLYAYISRNTYLRLLQENLVDAGGRILGYCLMSNHRCPAVSS